jgi:hypothetical protein
MVAALPATLTSYVEKSNVPVKPLKLIVKQSTLTPKVTVPPPLLALNNTASAAVGTDSPPAPPEVADQFAVFIASQVPVPPTQYLFAIVSPFA